MKKFITHFLCMMLLASCASNSEFNLDVRPETLADKKIQTMFKSFPAAPIKNSFAVKLIKDLEMFVMRDMPFNLEDRRQNIDDLKDIIDSSAEYTMGFPTDKQRLHYLSKSQLAQFMDSSSSQNVYQSINAAYAKELSYGNEIYAYDADLMYNGEDKSGVMTQFGRLALVWSNNDDSFHTCFDMRSESFLEITKELSNELSMNISGNSLLKSGNLPENWPCDYDKSTLKE